MKGIGVVSLYFAAALGLASATAVAYEFEVVYTPYASADMGGVYSVEIDANVLATGGLDVTSASVESVWYEGISATPWFGALLFYGFAQDLNPAVCEPSGYALEICRALGLQPGDLLYLYQNVGPRYGFAFRNLRFGRFLRGDKLMHADANNEYQISFTGIGGNLWRMDYHLQDADLPWCEQELPGRSQCEGIIGRFVSNVPSPGLPEPGSLALLGLGLAGLGLSRRLKAA